MLRSLMPGANPGMDAAAGAADHVPPGDDATFAASVILRLYPCGIRRY